MNTDMLSDAQHRARAMHQFACLSREEKDAAIRELARSGMSDHGIASACRLAVEQVRRVLAERAA